MLIDRYSWRLHLLWALLALVMTIGLIGWYGFESWSAGVWLGGGSLPGLVLGIVAAAIIGFEMLLWPRKALRRLRLLPTKYWMSAHLWFGFACLPLGLVHSGWHLGGWLTTLLLVLLILTVFSGVFGLIMQNVLPKAMWKRLPAETIVGEIDRVAASLVGDADQMMVAACGPRDSVMTMELGDAELTRFRELLGEQGNAEMTRMIVIGAPRDAERRERFAGQSGISKGHGVTGGGEQRDDARSLWVAYDELRPFLMDGATRGEVFGDASRATGWFRLLRRACSAEAERVIGPLERLADQRRQFLMQRRMHGWLHAWLPFHIAFSVGLCVLLVAHIFFALRYW